MKFVSICQQAMGEGLPAPSRTLEDGAGAAVLVEPSPQGEELVVWRAKVPPLRAELTLVISPAPTRRQLRRMAINPPTHGVHHWHAMALLEEKANTRGDVRAPAHRGVLPTRDLSCSTWRGAASRTHRCLSRLQALSMYTVLWLTSWGAVYRKSRLGGRIASGGAQPTGAWMFPIPLGYYGPYTLYLVLAATQHQTLPVFSIIMLAFAIPLTGITLIVVWIRAIRARSHGVPISPSRHRRD